MLLGLPVIGACIGACSDRAPGDSDSAAALSRGESRLEHVRIDVADSETDGRHLLDLGFDVLEGSMADKTLEIIASPEEITRLEGLGYQPKLIAVGQPLKDSQKEALAYPTLDEMLGTMHSIESEHPDIATVVDLTLRYGVPATAEGRHLQALKISRNVHKEEDEPTYLIVSNHHARELGPPVVAMLAMQQLTSLYATDERIRNIVDTHEIWIAPTWNPDGLEYVHTTNNMWRKNRRPNGGGKFGVDLNRNYPNLWSTSCSGSTSQGSDTYKGTSPASEAETQTMLAFTLDRRFQKVLDFHSSGREVLVDYSCSNYALSSYFSKLGKELANRMGYQGHTRRPDAQGEHGDYELGTFSNLFFLIEINQSFQPAYTSAQAEAEQIWPGILWHMEQPTPLSGHVTDARTGKALAASVTVKSIAYSNGEENSSGGPFGRYQAFIPAGTYEIEVAASGYATEQRTVTIADGSESVLDVALTPL